jgi:hypothetical protein
MGHQETWEDYLSLDDDKIYQKEALQNFNSMITDQTNSSDYK